MAGKTSAAAKKRRRKNWWKYPVAVLIIFITILPLYVLIEMSLKRPTDLASRLTWPTYFYIDNYIKVLRSSNSYC